MGIATAEAMAYATGRQDFWQGGLWEFLLLVTHIFTHNTSHHTTLISILTLAHYYKLIFITRYVSIQSYSASEISSGSLKSIKSGIR